MGRRARLPLRQTASDSDGEEERGFSLRLRDEQKGAAGRLAGSELPSRGLDRWGWPNSRSQHSGQNITTSGGRRRMAIASGGEPRKLAAA